jgi:hypothetical protein
MYSVQPSIVISHLQLEEQCTMGSQNPNSVSELKGKWLGYRDP